MPLLDLRHEPGHSGTRFHRADTYRQRPRGNALMVQGGGLADLLKTNTRFWAVDKVILAYFTFAMAVCVGWRGSLPEAAALFAANAIGCAVIIYEVKRPNRTSWVFRNWY